MHQNLLDKQPFFLACKESRIESPVSLYACFSLGPFHSTQSLTVANALRRTLLAEIPGISITSVQIEGVFHEYSSLNGVRESVLDILLNLKEVVLKNEFGIQNVIQNPKIGYLKARGPGIVRVRDLKLPSSIKCVNPDQYLFTLCEDGRIDMTFLIHQGKHGISLKNRSQTALKVLPEKVSIKTQKKNPFLELDALFSPIRQVNYIIEETHSSDHTILLELWTNGSCYPREALFYATKTLSRLFSRLEKVRILESSFVDNNTLQFSSNSADKGGQLHSPLLLKYEQQFRKPI